jgi:hypothetical protein
VVVTPPNGVVPLKVYLPRARVAREPAVTVQEIDLVGIAQRSSPGHEPVAPPASPVAATAQSAVPTFRLAGVRRDRMFTVVRFRASAPVTVPTAVLYDLGLGGGTPVVELER